MTYPRHDINPAQKGEKWILQYAKAAWNDSASVSSIFYKNALEYERISKYRNGTQEITPYKKFLTGDEQADTTWMKIDWKIRPVISTKRDIVISKILQKKTNIVCIPIDPLARDEADQYFADIRTKILMREALMQANPELAQSPELMPDPGEPQDLEELEMHMNYGYKHNAAMEAEQAIDLVQYQNDWQNIRKRVIESLFDFGVGGYKDGIDANGKVTIRDVNVQNIITNYCRKEDFSDLTHVGEVLEVSLADLADKFDDTTLADIAEKAASKDSLKRRYDRSAFNKDTDRFKVKVLDLEFFSYNTIVYRQRENEEGNLVYKKSKFENKGNPEKVSIKGKMESKYINKNVKVIYKCKWIIGTDYMYDFGIATNMKRDKSKMYDTCLSYHLYAYNFHEMKAQGYMERLIPIVDEYQNTIFKIQNFKQKWIPYIIDLDLDALESVALGKGGESMNPLDLLDMMFQTNVLVGRRKDQGGNPNYKSVEIRPTQMAEEFSVLVNDLGRLLQEMNIVMGLNELTDGSTPNAKTLVPVANSAIESTNNALYPLIYSDERLSECVAKGIVQRVQIAIKQGKIEGYVHALGTNTVKFIKVSPDISLHEYGIKIMDFPTDQQKMQLIERLNIKDANGMIDPEDYIMIMGCNNLKQAEMLLAYRVKKRREREEKKAMELQQQNGQIQVESAQAAEQSKQQTLQLEYQLKMELEKLKGEYMLQAKQMELQARQYTDDSKTLQAGMKVSEPVAAEE